MNREKNRMPFIFVLLLVFAVSMGYLETSVAYYERIILGISPSYNLNILPKFLSEHLIIEQLREISTILMLFAVGMLVGKSKIEKVAVFLFCFGVWDLSYYIFYYALIQWPTSLLTIDLLFLVPVPWIAPIILPITISIIMVVWSTYVIIKKNKIKK
jgi:hypothetical protein